LYTIINRRIGAVLLKQAISREVGACKSESRGWQSSQVECWASSVLKMAFHDRQLPLYQMRKVLSGANWKDLRVEKEFYIREAGEIAARPRAKGPEQLRLIDIWVED